MKEPPRGIDRVLSCFFAPFFFLDVLLGYFSSYNNNSISTDGFPLTPLCENCVLAHLANRCEMRN